MPPASSLGRASSAVDESVRTTNGVSEEVSLALEAVPIPGSFRCPISHDIMSDPVVTVDGQVYERSQIAEWFRRGHRTSPATGANLPSLVLTAEVPLR